MIGEESAKQSELQDAIISRINRRTGRQIQSLQVTVIGHQVVITGVASCYYHKQLALEGALETIGAANNGFQIELNVAVITSLRNNEAAHSTASEEGGDQ